MTLSDSTTQELAPLCSFVSRANDEQLFGTATEAQVWFILEHYQVYGSKAVEESDLPEVVKALLVTWVDRTPDSRVQLIKQENPPHRKDIAFFVGLISDKNPSFYEFHLSDYSDLFDLDVDRIISHSSDYAKYLRTDPLFLVCTNGKRDPCCVKFGFSFYHSLSNLEPESTWQTSHVGGHRFAANLVCFPNGLFYGRLIADDAQKVLETYRRGELLLGRYRGRCCFPTVVQAAEYYLREQTGEIGIPAFSLESVISIGENRWEILFRESSHGRRHQLVIAGVPSEYAILKSCRDLEKSKVMQFHLEGHKVIQG